MGSKRSTLVFVIIVGCALLLVGVLAVSLLDIQRDGESDDSVDDLASVPQDAVVVSFHSSNTKEHWVDEMVADFNAGDHQIASGEPIHVQAYHVTSGGSYQAIMDGEIQPTIWSPGSGIWLDKANQSWSDLNSRPLVQNLEQCPDMLHIPLVIGMWKPMAEALG